ncbi:trypsin-like serine protease [Humisphaera borealis]|uniref:Serine protease n=1 Tax=Humisphaera borealis TaxID=2807512 RepID=A0A7M2WT98_9BACT|nr:trypsin-like serine protease [Humisphaera borealis]QOV88653.1 trypsin-like serine protease [Humisphaera borealis]
MTLIIEPLGLAYLDPQEYRLRYMRSSGVTISRSVAGASTVATGRTKFTRGFLRALALLVIALPTLPARAVYIRHDRSVGDYNAIGARPTFGASGYLADSRDGFEIGSATLVSPTKILTAAHVFDDDGDLAVDRPRAFKYLTFGTQTNIPSALSANVKSIKINPAYKGGKAAFDLAVITLSSPVNGVTPGRMSSRDAVGKRGAMVGYGFQGTGRGLSVPGAANKLGAFNEISILRDGTYQTDFDSPTGNTSTFGPSTPLTYEGTTASGDSGSALWADFGNNAWNIVGVLNGGFNKKGQDFQYGDVSIYASLANTRNISFLTKQGLSLGAGGSAAGSSVVGNVRSAEVGLRAIPEPGALLVAPLLLLAGFRRPQRTHQ